MMPASYLRPTLQIAGSAVSDLWSDTYDGPIALADPEINWGRSSFLEKNSPATLSITIMEKSGTLAFGAGLVGLEVILSHPSLTFFRGVVTDAPVEIIERVNSRGNTDTWYAVKLEAVDHLATFAQAKVLGSPVPASQLPNWVTEGRSGTDYMPNKSDSVQRFWVEGGAGTRQDHIGTTALSYLPSIARNWGYPLPQAAVPSGATYQHIHKWHKPEEELSLLDVYRMMAATWPLAEAYYDPTYHDVSHIKPQPDVKVYGTRQNGAVRLEARTDPENWGASVYRALVVPGSAIEWPSQAVLEQTVTESVDRIEIQMYRITTVVNSQGYSVRSVTEYTRQAVITDRPEYSAKTLTYQTDLMEEDVQGRYYSGLTAKLSTVVRGLNGKFRLPSLTFSAERHPEIDAATRQALVTPYPLTRTFYFSNAEISRVANVGPSFMLIGGTLKWNADKGWSHDMTLTPTWGTISAPLRLNQLFPSNSPVKLSELDISFNDMNRIREGII